MPDRPPEAEAARVGRGDGLRGTLRQGSALPLLILLVACLFLFGWGIGSYSLNDPWEPRYPQTVREMMARGDFVTPYEGGLIRWTKPILIYWAIWIPTLIFGNNEFSARLPSVLAATGGVLSIAYALTKLRSPRAGLLAGCVLATTPLYFFMARQSTPDMLLAASLAAAMAFFALGRFGAERRRALHFGIAYAALGLAVLAKGPVACVIAVVSVSTFWLIDFDARRLASFQTVRTDLMRTIAFYKVALGVLVFLVVAGPWYVAIWAKHGDAFVDNFIRGENLHRFSEPVKGLKGTSAHYVETMFHGMFPWISFLPAALFFLGYGKRKLDDELRLTWYFLAWLISIFVIFTASGTKLDHYILPLTASLAVLVGLVWEEYTSAEPPFWVRPALLLSLAFLILPFRDFLLLSNQYIMDAYTNKQIIENIDIEHALEAMYAIWAVILVACACLPRRAKLLATLAMLAAFAMAIYFSHYVLPKQEYVRSVKHYVQYYRAHETGDSRLIFFGKRRHTVTYYMGGEDKYGYYESHQLPAMLQHLPTGPPVYIIAESDFVNQVLGAVQNQTRARWYKSSSDNRDYQLLSNVPLPNRLQGN